MKDSRSGLSESLRKFGLHRTERRTPSRAYERFFENYEETREAGRVVRRYRGDYRLRPGTARGRLLRSLVYLALWLLSAGLLVLCAVQPLDLNRRWYSAAPQAIAVGALGFGALALARYFAQPQRMELRQYRESSVTLCRASLAAAAALALLAAAYLAGGEPLWALPALAAAAASAAEGLAERRLEYPLEKAGDDSADT